MLNESLNFKKNDNPYFANETDKFGHAFCSDFRLSIKTTEKEIINFFKPYNLIFILQKNKNTYGYEHTIIDKIYKVRIMFGGYDDNNRVLLECPTAFTFYLQQNNLFFDFFKNLNNTFPNLIRCNQFTIIKDSYQKNVFGWLKPNIRYEKLDKKCWTAPKYNLRKPYSKDKFNNSFDGFCFYLGNSNSCIFDKAAESGIENKTWHRFKIQLNYSVAKVDWTKIVFELCAKKISLDDIFMLVARSKFIILKDTCPNKIKNIKSEWLNYSSESYKKFLISHTTTTITL